MPYQSTKKSAKWCRVRAETVKKARLKTYTRVAVQLKDGRDECKYHKNEAAH